MVRIQRYSDARVFQERTREWLLRNEAEYNLLLGLTDTLVAGTHRYDEPIYLASVERDGQVCGCAFRTPPYKFGLTAMPPEAVPPLVDDASTVYTALHTVLGPSNVAERFAECWAARHGCGFATGMRQGIYALHAVVPPARPAPGTMREARSSDEDICCAWSAAFHRDTGLADPDPDAIVRRFIDRMDLFVWESDGVRAMAATGARTPNGVRIGFVYTPPEYRGRGYATTLVAQLSQRILDSGKRFCFLYTDLGNPTSNAIYRRIGYQPVCEVTDVDFV